MTDDPKTTAATNPAATRLRLRHFSKSLPMSLLRARESVMRHFRKSLREFGVTEQQWRVLRALSTMPQMEVAELARATFLLGPSLSRILADLDQRKLIVRTADPADLRRWMISLNPAGTALIDTVTPVSEAIYREISQRFGADKLADLQSLLAELEQAMVGIGSDTPDAPTD
ncbi:homoprotocatechuate degradation operon regulator, HpaR [Bosea sp. Tri-49]|uniref:homoprotocatechuate degradation operon regulator HpaR n=1 Tax=Bosea sp. Tri-49 TaxID=1867715 RepID=UPI000F74C4E4|nr:homoprotocatechuate degradation operon regulator, HpaR [Bosea sp. Tri-49]